MKNNDLVLCLPCQLLALSSPMISEEQTPGFQSCTPLNNDKNNNDNNERKLIKLNYTIVCSQLGCFCVKIENQKRWGLFYQFLEVVQFYMFLCVNLRYRLSFDSLCLSSAYITLSFSFAHVISVFTG
jgi:hypothetical protein